MALLDFPNIIGPNGLNSDSETSRFTGIAMVFFTNSQNLNSVRKNSSYMWVSFLHLMLNNYWWWLANQPILYLGCLFADIVLFNIAIKCKIVIISLIKL